MLTVGCGIFSEEKVGFGQNELNVFFCHNKLNYNGRQGV